ncbi:hypothetical protein [Ruminococcus flavefaciens]|uniref:Uncharacterized protein n=1 Tax=Ruminococcus flavefaciens 007c TaxID=1341157 RepID=W7UHF0_RUMFL|nr:hypothetical protein [Ruminococcus flavefaciens]EWM54606.1 hypothetical protein RF007C_03885 [Ruminococcus flavefaciens 007c]
MKRTVKAFAAAFFAAFMCIFGGINAFAWDHDETWMKVSFQNAPEGTAYVDLLLKDAKNDSTAVDYNEEYEKHMGEDRVSLKRDCGLAKYNEDGYTSMTLRHNFVMYYDTNSDEAAYSQMKMKTHRIFNKHRCVKLAYCDSKGEVIGVTNEIKVPYNDFAEPVMYNFSGDGEKLSFKFGGNILKKHEAAAIWIINIIVYLSPAILLVLAFVLYHKIRERRLKADSIE